MSSLPRVMCIGSASKDIFFPTNEGIILETPEDLTAQTKVAFELGGKFHADDRFESIGGVAANVATGLCRLGIATSCYSVIGQDEIGQYIRSELERFQVDTTSLMVDATVKSDLSAIIVITQSGDRIIFHNRDANEKLSVIPENIRSQEWIYMSALNGPWEINFDAILNICRTQQLRLAFNPGQHNLKSKPAKILAALKETHLLLLNKDEAIELLLSTQRFHDTTMLRDETFLLRELYALGVPMIGLTDGKRGAWAYDGKTMLHANIFEPRGLVDTTGAGDAFGSGFFAALLWKLPLETCLRYGVANAGSVVGFYGAIEGLLTQNEVIKFIPKIFVETL